MVLETSLSPPLDSNKCRTATSIDCFLSLALKLRSSRAALLEVGSPL